MIQLVFMGRGLRYMVRGSLAALQTSFRTSLADQTERKKSRAEKPLLKN